MAALTITTSQVVPAANCPEKDVVAGEAITPGQAVYSDEATGTWKLAQNDGTAAEAGSAGYGIALSQAAAANQPIVVALPGGTVTLGAGAAPAAGTPYAIGATPGALVPLADLASTNKVTWLCVGTGTNKVKILSGAYDAGAVKP
jgi:hypothetical protein